jgi:hypothetical protein
MDVFSKHLLSFVTNGRQQLIREKHNFKLEKPFPVQRKLIPTMTYKVK